MTQSEQLVYLYFLAILQKGHLLHILASEWCV